MKTFDGITEPLESCGCPSILSIWGDVDTFVTAHPALVENDATLRSTCMYLVSRIIYAGSTRPKEAVALAMLLILRPANPTGTSFGQF